MTVITRHQRPQYDITAINDVAQSLFDGVQYILHAMYCIQEVTGGSVESGSASVTPGNNVDIYDDGVDVVQLQVSAGGAVTIQRTAGADTFNARIEAVWL